jgi:hypothetical protein
MKQNFFDKVFEKKLTKFDTVSNKVLKIKYSAISDKLSEYTAKKNNMYNVAVKDMVGDNYE